MSTKTQRATKIDTDLVRPSHLASSTLPNDWEWVSLGSICRTTSGGTPSRKYKAYFEGDIPWVKSGELPDGPVLEVEEYITGEAIKKSSAKQFPKGTLLIALYGATVGKLGVLTKEAATNQAVCAIFPHDYLETKYLFWYLRFVRSDLIAQAIGGAQPNISQGIIRNLLIPVAPPYEQKRIVAEIEKQFSRLDEAVANLKRVKANLKRYKAAVLKAAVEGKLTEDWRKQHSDVEPASKLLERILTERRAKWKRKGKYKEPAEMDASARTFLPGGWLWASIEALSTKVVDGVHKKPNYVSSGVPFVTVRNLTAGPGINLVKLNFVTKEDHEQFIKRADPGEGDVLISKDGTLGVVRVVRTKTIFSIFVSVALVKPVLREMSDYLGVALSSPQVQAQMVPKGSGLQHIHLEDLRADCVPVPPSDEQKEIVSEVERRLSVIEELEAAVEANLTRANRLRQSILSQAFSGRLPMAKQ